MALTLHPLQNAKGRRPWCGPAAVAMIANADVDEVHGLIRRTTGKTRVMGTHVSDLNAAAHAYGFRFVLAEDFGHRKTNDRPTLAAWITGRKDRAALILVELSEHWVLVQGNRFADNHTKAPVATSTAPHRRQRVHRTWRVREDREDIGAIGALVEKLAKADLSKLTPPVLASLKARLEVAVGLIETAKPRPSPTPAPAPKRPADPAYAAWRAFAAEHGLNYKIDRSNGIGTPDVIVWPCPAFPRGIGTLHYNWSETLDRLKGALADPASEVIEPGDDSTPDWISR